MGEENDPKGFRVKDSRRFNADGENPEATEEHRGESFTARPAAGDDFLPEMNFSTFVLSLNASGLVHLGLVADSQTGEPPLPHFGLAQQIIDILAMLQQKTEGNLTNEESRLLQGILYELRMKFVEQRRLHQQAR